MIPAPPLRVGIVGSRGWPNDLVHLVMRATTLELFGIRNRDRSHVIVTGDCRNVDEMARVSAHERNIPLVVFCASSRSPERLSRVEGSATYIVVSDWDEDGKAAGPRRNRTLVDNIDELYAFWDGSSPGTAGVVRMANAANVRTCVVTPDRRAVTCDRGTIVERQV